MRHRKSGNRFGGRRTWLAATLLVAAGGAGAVALAQMADSLQSFGGHLAAVTMADFVPGAPAVATSSADHTLKLFDTETGAEITTFEGHQAPVTSLAVSPDGRVLASGAQDNTIRLWDIPQPKPLASIAGHEGPAGQVALSPDAGLLLSVGEDRLARLWRLPEGEEAAKLEGHTAALASAAYRPDHNQLATGDAAGYIRLWRDVDFQADGTLGGHYGRVISLIYLPNNQQLLSAGEDGTVKVWQLPSTPPRAVPGEATPVSLAAVSADGKLVATAGQVDDRPTILIRNSDTGDLLVALRGHEAAVTGLAFHPNGTRLVSVSEDQTARVWDLSDSKFPQLIKFDGHTAAVRAVALSSDGNTVFSAGDDLVVRQWQLVDGQGVREFAGHAKPVHCLAVAGDTLASGGVEPAVRIWAIGTGEAARSIDCGAPPARLALSPDQTKLAAAAAEQPIKLYTVADGQELARLPADQAVADISFSPNNQNLIATTGSVVRVWDVAVARQLEFFADHANTALAARILPDNRSLVSVDADNQLRVSMLTAARVMAASDGAIADAALYAGSQLVTVGGDRTARLWNVGNGQLVREITPPVPAEPADAADAAEPPPAAAAAATVVPFTAVAVRADNAQLAVADAGGQVFIFNPGNGSPIAQFQTPAAARAVDFSRDNQKLVVAGGDQQLRVYATADQTLQQELAAESAILDAMFLPDSRHLVTSHDAGALQMWAYASPVATRTLTGHGSGIYNIVFSNDGGTLASASADNTIRFWSATAGNQIRQLSGHAGTVFGLALSPDSSLLVSASADGTIRLWDRLGGRQLKQINAPGALYSVAFHPGGKIVAAGGIDRQVFVYDLFAGALQKTLEGHPDYVYSVTYNAAGNRLLSCGYGGHLFVWDVGAGKAVFSTRLPGVVNYARYAPDQTKVLVAMGDGTARLIELPAAAR